MRGREAVAWYKNAQNVVKCNGSEPVWTTDYKPGSTVPRSGIYRCRNCGKEVTCNADDPFPPQNHHQHPQAGSVLWRLIIWTNTSGDNHHGTV